MKVIISVLATISIVLISPIISEISNGESVELRRIGHNVTTNSSSNAFDSNNGLNLKIDHSFTTDNSYNITNLIRIGDVLNVFRIESIGASWSSFKHRVHQNCSRDLFEYIKGLEGGKAWAVKSECFFFVVVVFVILFLNCLLLLRHCYFEIYLHYTYWLAD